MSHLETVPNQPPAPNHGPLMGFDLKATGPESGQFRSVPHPQLPYPSFPKFTVAFRFIQSITHNDKSPQREWLMWSREAGGTETLWKW